MNAFVMNYINKNTVNKTRHELCFCAVIYVRSIVRLCFVYFTVVDIKYASCSDLVFEAQVTFVVLPNFVVKTKPRGLLNINDMRYKSALGRMPRTQMYIVYESLVAARTCLF